MEHAFQKSYLKKTQQVFVCALLAHVPACTGVAMANHVPVGPVIGLGLAICAGPILSWLLSPGQRRTTFACAVALMCFSGLLIHAAQGMIEFHFHVFVSLSLLIVFGDWLALVLAAVVIAAHHAAFYFFLPASVFNYHATFSVVLIHATFVVLATIPDCLIAWRFGGFIRAQGLLSERLNGVTCQMVTQVQQLDQGSCAVAEGASRQAASIQETSSALECISSATRLNAENAENAKEFASMTRVAADFGVVEIESMRAAMSEIKESSNNIAKIIKVIDEIAFQTNILALNAAVEAARAGESGLGFAIVADEVRTLAQRCAGAARETSEKIADSIGKSQKGADISSKITQSLQEIAGKARQVDELIVQIADSSAEQNRGILQVKSAISAMDKETRQNAISACQSAASIQDLNRQATELKDVVLMLEQMVGCKVEGVSASASLPRKETGKNGSFRQKQPPIPITEPGLN